MSEQQTTEIAEECGSCGEGVSTGECPKSERPCGHHCNHVWTHDACDWCGAEFGPDDWDPTNCTCKRYVVDYSDPDRYHPENVDREDDPACPIHGTPENCTPPAKEADRG